MKPTPGFTPGQKPMVPEDVFKPVQRPTSSAPGQENSSTMPVFSNLTNSKLNPCVNVIFDYSRLPDQHIHPHLKIWNPDPRKMNTRTNSTRIDLQNVDPKNRTVGFIRSRLRKKLKDILLPHISGQYGQDVKPREIEVLLYNPIYDTKNGLLPINTNNIGMFPFISEETAKAIEVYMEWKETGKFSIKNLGSFGRGPKRPSSLLPYSPNPGLNDDSELLFSVEDSDTNYSESNTPNQHSQQQGGTGGNNICPRLQAVVLEKQTANQEVLNLDIKKSILAMEKGEDSEPPLWKQTLLNGLNMAREFVDRKSVDGNKFPEKEVVTRRRDASPSGRRTSRKEESRKKETKKDETSSEETKKEESRKEDDKQLNDDKEPKDDKSSHAVKPGVSIRRPRRGDSPEPRRHSSGRAKQPESTEAQQPELTEQLDAEQLEEEEALVTEKKRQLNQETRKPLNQGKPLKKSASNLLYNVAKLASPVHA